MSKPPPNLPVQVLSALARGDKIEAIKLVREMTGLGLREAKDTVEGKRGFHGAPPHASPHVTPHSTPHAPGQAGSAGDVLHRAADNGLAPGEQPRATAASSLAWWGAALLAVGLLVYLYIR